VLEYLRGLGVKAELFGSITNETFGLSSDVDFLVTECPDGRRYRIEAKVEDVMRGIPFDVVYLDEASEEFKRFINRHE
jgi:predicted nucleotidyltransferase